MVQRCCLAVVMAVLLIFPAAGVARSAERGTAEGTPAENKDAEKKEERPLGYEQAAAAGERPAAPEAADAGDADDDTGRQKEEADMLAGPVDPQVANLEKQFLPRIRPLLKAELSFVKRVCQPDRQQRQSIAKASERCLQVAARNYAMGQHELRRGRRRNQAVSVEPNRLIQQELLRIIRSNLDAEQATRYEQEISKRLASRKHAAVLGLVAKLDRVLVLSAQQRQELIKSLSEHWQDPWNQSLQMMMVNNQYLPQIPDKVVVPVLSDTQRDVWHQTQKQSPVHWGWLGGPGHDIVVDDFDGEIAAAGEGAVPAEDRADD